MTTLRIAFNVDESDLYDVGVYLMLALIDEQDWDEDEEQPLMDVLAERLSPAWLRNELRSQLRSYGATFGQSVYDRLVKRSDRSAIEKAVAKRIEYLFPVKE